MAEFNKTIDDAVTMSDAVASLPLFGATAVVDHVIVGDSLSVGTGFVRALSDSVMAFDALQSGPVIALKIAEARMLGATKLRIDFEKPALSDQALVKLSSYIFNNPAPGSVEVIPLSVALPPGQLNPMYVEIETSEHTNGALYEVAISNDVHGAEGEIGQGVPFSYEAIGAAPALQLVLAVSATEAQVHFSEPIANNAAANTPGNYIWSGGISTIAVRGVVGNVVTLQTTTQLPGQLYSLTVVGLGYGELYDIELFTDEVEAGDDEPVVLVESNERVVEDSIVVNDTILAQVTLMHSVFASTRQSPPPRPEIQVSLDDVVWTSTNPSPSPVKTVKGGGRNPLTGTIVLVGESGLVLRSSDDGLTWAQLAPWATSIDAFGCWYGNGRWIVGTLSATNQARMYYSDDDGMTWLGPVDPDNGTGTGGGAPAGASDLFVDGCYAAELGVHVAVGYFGAIWTSPTGISSWSRRTPAGGFTGVFSAVTYAPSPGLLCVVGWGGECQTSPNGITWTKQTLSPVLPMSNVNDATWSPELGLFLVVGESASFVARLQTSPDGINWTAQTPASEATGRMWACTWDARRGLFLAGGNKAQLQTSPDGINWTAQTPANTGGNFVADSGSTIFVIIGGGRAA